MSENQVSCGEVAGRNGKTPLLTGDNRHLTLPPDFPEPVKQWSSSVFSSWSSRAHKNSVPVFVCGNCKSELRKSQWQRDTCPFCGEQLHLKEEDQ